MQKKHRNLSSNRKLLCFLRSESNYATLFITCWCPCWLAAGPVLMTCFSTVTSESVRSDEWRMETASLGQPSCRWLAIHFASTTASSAGLGHFKRWVTGRRRLLRRNAVAIDVAGYNISTLKNSRHRKAFGARSLPQFLTFGEFFTLFIHSFIGRLSSLELELPTSPGVFVLYRLWGLLFFSCIPTTTAVWDFDNIIG